MRRLIDANALMEQMHNHYQVRNPAQNATMDECCMMVFHAPTVDAVEVVRCKDCAFHRWDGYSYGCINLKGLRGDLKDYFFCPHGKKKDRNDFHNCGAKMDGGADDGNL